MDTTETNASRPIDYATDSRLLTFFLSKETGGVVKVLAYIGIFFLIPSALVAVSAVDGVLFIEGDAVGMMDDYLFLSFAFVVAPLLFVFLMYVIRQFMNFLEEIPKFTTLDEEAHTKLRKETLELVTNRGSGNWVVFVKYLIGVGSLASNMSSISGRVDGWNGLAQPLEYWITFLYLVIMLCFVVNSILIKYIQILFAEIRVTRSLATDDVIVVRPLAPDKAGGLRSLGELSLAFTYFLLPFSVVGLTHYYTWRVLTIGSTINLIAFIPLFVIVFFVPLGVVHRVMADTKRNTLQQICDKYLEVNKTITSDLKADKGYEEVAPHREMMDMLGGMYEKADKMPVWPFNMKTLTQFFSITLGPLAIVFLESTIQRFISMFLH